MNVIYKILAEVKLFHEYYLTEATGQTIFAYAGQPAKNDFLLRAFEANRPTIANDITFEILPDMADHFANHKIRVVPSYSGFRILVQVTTNSLSDNSVVFTPASPLPSEIVVGLRRKNTSMEAHTNARIKTPLRSIFYFSNKGAPAMKEFPVLSGKIPAYDLLSSYEQGELSLSASAAVQSYFLNDDGNDEWMSVPGSGFVNERDRILITPKFSYTFPGQAVVGEVKFTLRDSAGQDVQTFTLGDANGLRTATLDFNTRSLFKDVQSRFSEKFFLEVSGNSFQQEHELVFIDTNLDLQNYWGIVHLVPKVEDEQFNLVDDNGYLRTRRNPDGSIAIPEYFEIRVKSRPTFWRYVNQQGRKLKSNTALDDFLGYDAARGVMTSLSMRYASNTPVDFTGNGNSRFLPHPLSFDPITIEDGRLITEIRVPRSDLFDI